MDPILPHWAKSRHRQEVYFFYYFEGMSRQSTKKHEVPETTGLGSNFDDNNCLEVWINYLCQIEPKYKQFGKCEDYRRVEQHSSSPFPQLWLLNLFSHSFKCSQHIYKTRVEAVGRAYVSIKPVTWVVILFLSSCSKASPGIWRLKVSGWITAQRGCVRICLYLRPRRRGGCQSHGEIYEAAFSAPEEDA